MKTNNFIIAVITAILLALSTNGKAQNRIVGGSYVDITERPFQVHLSYNHGNEALQASGVILNSRWIVTAAHVVDGLGPSDIFITCGATDWTSFGVYPNIKHIYPYPNYQGINNGIRNDIALIELEEPLVFTTRIQPIKISSSTSYPSGTIGTVSGWGYTNPGDSVSSSATLNKIDVAIESASNNFLKTSQSWYGSAEGDSGGPLTVGSGDNILLAGIVSHEVGSTSAANDKYYTNIGCYYNWILNTIYPLEQNHIYGGNLIGSTNTNFDIAYDSPDVRLEIGPGINMVSQSGNNVCFNTMSNGSSYLRLKDRFYTIKEKTVWCGIPVIFGIVFDGRLLRVLTNRDAGIYYTEWRIGGSQYSAYDDFIYPSYLPSGTQLVTVRARNGNGYSDYYSEYIDFNNNGSFYMTTNANSRLITVTPAEESVSDEPIEYVVSDIIKGNPVLSGSLPPAGGTIDCSQLKKGTYAIRLMNNKNQLSKKISL